LDVKKPAEKKEAKKEEVVNPYTETLWNAIYTGAGLCSLVGLGVLNPDPVFLGMLTTFSLAVIAGY